jgi:hypothetical protein
VSEPKDFIKRLVYLLVEVPLPEKESVRKPGWQSGQMRWPRESLSRKGRSGSNPDPGVVVNRFPLVSSGKLRAN